MRPEALRLVRAWREIIGALAVVALGAYALGAPGPVAQVFGGLLVVIGFGLALVGWRRKRFIGAGDAPGAVSVTEGQITYLGPFEGGAVALSLLTQLDLSGPPEKRRWGLVTEAGTRLEIPHDAAGAEVLFDVFASLPGLSTDEILRALRAAQTGTRIVWRRAGWDGLTLPRQAQTPRV